jgi:2-amino-4-hydroxy-6-hydroxymethyldihydropteridine diphosphokinase
MKPLLHRAQEMINARIGPVMRCSHRYKSAPWGFESGAHFSNQVLICDTDLSPREVLAEVHAIEQALGRDRDAEAAEKARTGQPYSSRVIDVDILFYGDEVISEKDLVIPHPLLHKRDFVLEPLGEVAPDKIHPVLGQTIAELSGKLKMETGK